MIILNPSDSLQVITSAAGAVDVMVCWLDSLDGIETPGRDLRTITAATTTSVTSANPVNVTALGKQKTFRKVLVLVIQNRHASIDQSITVLHHDGTTGFQIAKTDLAAGEALQFTADGGFANAAGDASVTNANVNAAITTNTGATWAALGGSGTSSIPFFVGARFGTATTADALSDVLLATTGATQRGLSIQGKAGQTGSMLRLTESSGSPVNNGWEFLLNSVTIAQSGSRSYFSPTDLLVPANFRFRWNSNAANPFSAGTTGFSQLAAGVFEIHNGTSGGTGHLQTNAAYIAGSEMTAPAAPAANGYRLYAEDNGSGKTRLMVKFETGAAQQLAIEP